MFPESCFFGNAANVGLHRSVLNGESADVPEDIVVDWSLRYPRSALATGTPHTFSVDDTVMHCRICVFRSANVIWGLIVKSLAYDHPSYTTTPI